VIGVNLRETLFMHEQSYVELFRAISATGVKLLMKQDAQRLTEKIVSPEVLLRPPVDT
jgi:hypothetical protein